MSPPSAQFRPHSRGIGSRAEQVVADALIRDGWIIVRRNYQIRGGELDIIAARQQTLAVFEVKYRRQKPSNSDQFAALIPKKKIHCIQVVAEQFRLRNGPECRPYTFFEMWLALVDHHQKIRWESLT